LSLSSCFGRFGALLQGYQRQRQSKAFKRFEQLLSSNPTSLWQNTLDTTAHYLK